MSTTTTPATTASSVELTPELLAAFGAQEQVSKQLLKQEIGKVYLFKFLGAIHEMAAEKARKNADGTSQKPMEVANVYNYADGKEYQLIVNAVLGNTLRETYPKHTYIGSTFRVTQLEVKSSRGGNKYATYDIVRGEMKGVKTPDAVPYVEPEIKTPAPVAAQENAAAQAAEKAPVAEAPKTPAPAPVAASKPAPVAARK
jgi:hypothetical protein